MSTGHLITKTFRTLQGYFRCLEASTLTLVFISSLFEDSYGISTSFLNELLAVKSTTQTLCSFSSGVVYLNQPVARTKYYGDCSFSIYAPWQRFSYPIHLTVFNLI